MQRISWRSVAAMLGAAALFATTMACAGVPGLTSVHPAPILTPTPLRTFMSGLQKDLPNGKTITINLWRYPNGQIQARLEQANDQYIGTLQRHFPNMPGQTVLFHLQGSDYIILGTIDETITGELSTVDFEPAGATNLNWLESLKVTRPSRSNPPIFAIIIRADEDDQWQGVQRIAIKTRESLNQLVEDPSTTGAAWEKKYDPPVDISSLFIDIQP